MEILKIKETCLYIKDLKQAYDFYHELLGLPLITYLPGKHLFLRAGSSVLLCFNPDDSGLKSSPPPHYANGKQHLAFEVRKSEYESAKEILKQRGIKITDEVVWESGASSFYFEDPAGNVLEIVPDRGIWD